MGFEIPFVQPMSKNNNSKLFDTVVHNNSKVKYLEHGFMFNSRWI